MISSLFQGQDLLSAKGGGPGLSRLLPAPQTEKIEEEVVEAVTLMGEAPLAPKTLEVLDCPEQPECTLGVVRAFLSPSEVLACAELCNTPGLEAITDRSDNLNYKHNAYRLEKLVRLWRPKLFNQMVNTAWSIDSHLWKNVPTDGIEVYPELELIEYDVKKMGQAGEIDPHVDNESLVSMVVLLTEPSEFGGGVNCFENGSAASRRVPLRAGDAIFFNGGDCEHWITPVTSGRRVVLQLELAKSIKGAWTNLMLANFCCCYVSLCAALYIFAAHVHHGFLAFIPIVLIVAGMFFVGGKASLPPNMRKSWFHQCTLFAAMLFGFFVLVSIPTYITGLYDEEMHRLLKHETTMMRRQ